MTTPAFAKVLILFAPTLFLLGCATPPADSQKVVYSAASVQTQIASKPCAVKVTQNGKLARSDVMSGTTRYLLKGDAFRIEVDDVLCNPSIGTFTKPSDFFYLAGHSAIATTAMFAMAGDTTSGQVLIIRTEDPRLISPFQDMFDSTEDKYREACIQLGKCPLKIRAFRSYWPFASDNEGTRRTYAEFKMLFQNRSIAGFKGDVPVVIYTNVVPKKTTIAERNAYFQVFAIQPFILHFE